MSAARRVKRCAIYIRVSTAMQRMEGWSLDAQRAALLALAKANGWKVVGIYADEGKSARKRLRERKEIHRLLADVKAGEIDIILFKELDRWFRNISDFYKVQDVLDAYGVTWHSQMQPGLEMLTKEGRLQVNLLLSVGQNEADSTSDRIKYTNKYMRQQKRWTAGPQTLPRGHMLDEDQHVLIDPQQEPFIRALIDRVFAGGSVNGSLVATNREFGQNFLYNNAMNLLRNPILGGAYMEVPDFVEKPYLTKEEFDRLQSLVARNARQPAYNLYIFSGLVGCPVCGCNMSGNNTLQHGRNYKYYRCPRANLHNNCTNRLSLNEIKLERQLLEYVREAVADRIAKVEAVHQERKKKPRKSNREQINRKLDKLEDVYINNDRMTKERYEKKRQAILAQLIEEEPEEQLPEIADLQKIQDLLDSGVLELYQDFTEAEKREFWLNILTRIEIRDAKVESVNFIE